MTRLVVAAPDRRQTGAIPNLHTQTVQGAEREIQRSVIDRILRIVAGTVLITLAATGIISLWGWIGIAPLRPVYSGSVRPALFGRHLPMKNNPHQLSTAPDNFCPGVFVRRLPRCAHIIRVTASTHIDLQISAALRILLSPHEKVLNQLPGGGCGNIATEKAHRLQPQTTDLAA
jgi:hypothetical protein